MHQSLYLPILPQAKVEEKKLDVIRTLYLKRVGGSFGLKVTENADGKGVRVSGVTPGGAADQNGQIFEGDHILKVGVVFNVLLYYVT
jgi:hypothetical protein